MSEAWEKVKGFVKAHPWLTAIGIFVVGLLFILWWRSGSKQAAAAPSTGLDAYYAASAAAVQSGNQLQAAQIAAQGATIQSNNQLTGLLAQYKAETDIAGIQATAMNNANTANTQQVAISSAAALGANAQNSTLAAFMADLARKTTDLQTVTSGFVSSQGSPATQEAIANQNLLQNLFAGSNSTGEKVQSLYDFARIMTGVQGQNSPGMPAFFTSPTFSAPASPSQPAANSNTATNSIVAAYGYDPRSFNSYG